MLARGLYWGFVYGDWSKVAVEKGGRASLEASRYAVLTSDERAACLAWYLVEAGVWATDLQPGPGFQAIAADYDNTNLCYEARLLAGWLFGRRFVLGRRHEEEAARLCAAYSRLPFQYFTSRLQGVKREQRTMARVVPMPVIDQFLSYAGLAVDRDLALLRLWSKRLGQVTDLVSLRHIYVEGLEKSVDGKDQFLATMLIILLERYRCVLYHSFRQGGPQQFEVSGSETIEPILAALVGLEAREENYERTGW